MGFRSLPFRFFCVFFVCVFFGFFLLCSKYRPVGDAAQA